MWNSKNWSSNSAWDTRIHLHYQKDKRDSVKLVPVTWQEQLFLTLEWSELLGISEWNKQNVPDRTQSARSLPCFLKRTILSHYQYAQRNQSSDFYFASIALIRGPCKAITNLQCPWVLGVKNGPGRRGGVEGSWEGCRDLIGSHEESERRSQGHKVSVRKYYFNLSEAATS